MIKNILLIDDHPSVREGHKTIIIRNCLAENISEAGTFNDGYQKALSVKPELILMDISLHGNSGIELTKKILKILPEIKIIIVSMYSKTHYIVSALEAGARGYILKESRSEKIVECIKNVLNGEVYVDSHISGKVISSLLPDSDEKMVMGESYESLTLREQEVLRLLAEGLSCKEIADQLYISEKTAINHRTNIMSKLECSNMVELVKYAIHIGLIEI
jgi:DNA-binding NarL/FixJ family response regulator